MKSNDCKARKEFYMKKLKIAAVILLLISLTACSNKNNEKIELTISAAASMQGALSDLQKLYEEEHKNVHLYFNFGASGALQQQIEQGAPVDLFLSASEDKFDSLVEKGFIMKKNNVDLVGNELVLIQNKKSKTQLTGFRDLLKPTMKRMAIGTPESVPAGKYAQETLKQLNIWSQLDKRIVFAKDVRQVLTYVETGNVDAGIVYKTDALVSQKVEIMATADSRSHTPIIYPLGVVKASKQREEAISFYQFLKSEKAKTIFEDYGFSYLIK